MDIETFIIKVFCVVDDSFKSLTKGQKLRTRGPSPFLTDAEVITMEIVGEFLGFDADKTLWEFFDNNWRGFFPCLGDRTAFLRQAANLTYWKQRLLKKFAQDLKAFDEEVHIVDGFPIPVVKFARANFCKSFKGDAAYGFCAAKKETYFGFKGHLLISKSGVISEFSLTPANIDERDVAPELCENIVGTLLGDKGYLRPELMRELLKHDIYLETPVRKNMQEVRKPKYLHAVQNVRRKIESVIAQLTERFHIEKVRARDLWHLISRISRKLLAHSIGVLFACECGAEPLQLERIFS